MKYIFSIFFIIIIYNCHQKRDDKFENKILKNEIFFVRYLDTVFMSFILDSIYFPIDPSINEFGSRYRYSYSNGKDSLYILGYSLNDNPPHIDSVAIVKYILSKYKILQNSKIENFVITSHDGKIYCTYSDISKPYSYLNFCIYDQFNKISFNIIYQTQKIDTENTAAFQKLCNSFTFKVIMKK